jgi:thymidylate synthase ThyX
MNEMSVRIISCTVDPIDNIASAYAITRGLSYEEYKEKYNTPKKKQDLIIGCLESGHMSGLEFATIDVEVLGFSRVFEVDKVRSRLASYEIEAGRFTAARDFAVVVPPGISDEKAEERRLVVKKWFEEDIAAGIDPRIARYFTYQGLQRRGRISKNLRAWIETGWNRICSNTQWEYRYFYKLLKEAMIDLGGDYYFFAQLLQPKCMRFGYCPEVWESCGLMPKKKAVLDTYKFFQESQKQIQKSDHPRNY